MSNSTRGCVFEVTIQADSSDLMRIEILKGVLRNTGISEKAIIERVQWPHTNLSMYFASKVTALSVKRRLRSFHLQGVPVILKVLRKKDWQTKWKKEFKPFVLTRTFGVIPLWQKQAYSFRGKIPIYIDTDLAFGTGMHATTRFMARLIERCRGRFGSFLDLGTGTGILAILGAKCGAKDVKAIDISEDAVKVARRNCQENSCRSITVTVEDVQKHAAKAPYDFVAANIITQELIRMAETIVGFVKPGKYLAVSGISTNSYPAFRQAYSRYPLRCVKIEKGEGWVALLYKKTL